MECGFAHTLQVFPERCRAGAPARRTRADRTRGGPSGAGAAAGGDGSGRSDRGRRLRSVTDVTPSRYLVVTE
ncbi:hypothetical protein GCM10009551_030110 [Nocardiopsis tropica]